MDTPSTGEPAFPVTSVQVLEPHGAPEPPDRQRSWLVPGMALLLLVAFGGGYLLARNPGLTPLPDITEESTLATTTTVRSTTSTMPAGQAMIPYSTSPWFVAPTVIDEGVTLVARGEGVDDVAVDSGGNVWALGSGVATRLNPTDGTFVTFGREVFGHAPPNQVAAAPDGVVWIAAGSEVFRFDGTWTRFRNPETEEWIVGLEVTPGGSLVIVAAGGDDWRHYSWLGPRTGEGVRLHRSAPGGELATVQSLAMDLPFREVTAIAVGPSDEVWLAAGDGDAWGVFRLKGSRLAPLPELPTDAPVSGISVADRVWVTDGAGLYGLEGDAWVGIDLPDTGEDWWLGEGPWTIGAVGDTAWAAAATPDESGLQLVEVESPSAYGAHPPLNGVSGFVSSIEVAADGAVWIGTDSGLCSFDPTTGEWRLWTTLPAEGVVPAEIGSMAVGSDGTLLAVVYTDPPRIISFDGSTWEVEEGLAPASWHKGGDCDIGLSAWRDGTVWALFADESQSTLWRRGTDGTWDPLALPDQLREGFIGAGPHGTLWLMHSTRTALFDGTAWTVWNQADVPDDRGLWVGEDGTPWALEEGWAFGRLWFFGEGRWMPAEPPVPGGRGPVAVVAHREAIWVATENSVASFDGTTWTLQFESRATVSALAAVVDGGMWVAAGDLWLIGDGHPVLVARDLDTWQLTADPDGSVWALAGGGLYHVEYPA